MLKYDDLFEITLTSSGWFYPENWLKTLPGSVCWWLCLN